MDNREFNILIMITNYDFTTTYYLLIIDKPLLVRVAKFCH